MTAYRIATDEREPCYISELNPGQTWNAYGWVGQPERSMSFPSRRKAEEAAQFVGDAMGRAGYGEAAALLRIVPKRGGAATGWRYQKGVTNG